MVHLIVLIYSIQGIFGSRVVIIVEILFIFVEKIELSLHGIRHFCFKRKLIIIFIKKNYLVNKMEEINLPKIG